MPSTCFTQSCEQVISGRYLTYDRILEIIQYEEYLNYANLQFVNKRRLRKVKEFILFLRIKQLSKLFFGLNAQPKISILKQLYKCLTLDVLTF